MPDPDDKILFDALREAGASENSAYTAVQEVRNMAGQSVTAELGSKIDALRVELNGKIDAQGTQIDAQGTKIDAQKEVFGSEIRTTRWMMGAILALLAILAALGLFNTALGLMDRG